MNNLQNNYEGECQAFGCYTIGTEYVEMNLDNNNVITIWTCQRCAKKLKSEKKVTKINTNIKELCENLKVLHEDIHKMDLITRDNLVEVQ